MFIRPEHVNVLGNVERIVGVVRIGERDGVLRSALVRLDEHQQLAEHFADVAAVDLVDDEDVRLRGVFARALAKLVKDAILQREPTTRFRAPALNEVLVRVRLVKLHRTDTGRVLVADPRVRQSPSKEGLADTRRPFENQVLLSRERLNIVRRP